MTHGEEMIRLRARHEAAHEYEQARRWYAAARQEFGRRPSDIAYLKGIAGEHEIKARWAKAVALGRPTLGWLRGRLTP